MTEDHEKIGREAVVQFVLRMKGMMSDISETEAEVIKDIKETKKELKKLKESIDSFSAR